MRIGLTGGIGAGKSTVLRIFEESGCYCCDTDIIVAEFYETNEMFRELLEERWGISKELPSLEAKKNVANVVFANEAELIWLEKMLHPLVNERLQTIFSEKQNSLVVCAVPLLYETKMEKYFDQIVTVSCDRKLQYERLKQRNWSDDDIDARLKRQFSMIEKEKRADVVINNCSSLNFLESQCRSLVARWYDL